MSVKYTWRHAVIFIRFLTGSTHGGSKQKTSGSKQKTSACVFFKSSIVISVDLHNFSLPLWRVHEIIRTYLASCINGLFIT